MAVLTAFKRSSLVHAFFAISYFTSGLVINLIQFCLVIFVKPFNKIVFRKLMYYVCYSFNSQLVFMADWWSQCKVYVYIEPEMLDKYVGKEHVLLMMNHCYEIDWLLGWVFCEKVGVLGNCKAYVKKALQYIPTVGLSWKFAEYVFLERSYDKDRAIIAKQLNEILDYPSSVWLLLNAEGTRFTTAKHNASIQFARERGMPELKHHLIPRSKGFTTSLPHLREKCPAIYDIQLAISKNQKNVPTLSSLLVGEGVTAHLLIRRIPISDVPLKEEEAAQWLQDLFVQKDQLQENFFKYGNFFENTELKSVQPILMEPRLYTLLNTLGWAFAVLVPLFYYLIKALFTGQFMVFGIGLTIIVAFYILMQKSIGMSKISKASSYGVTSATTFKKE